MSLSQNVSYAWRSLRRAPAFSAAVVLTLTIGIGAAAAIFAVVNAVLLRPLPYGHPEQLVGAWHDMPALSLMHGQQTQGTYYTYKKFAHSIEDIGVYDDGSVNVADPDGRADPERMDTGWLTANLIPLLQISPILGRSFTEAEDTPNNITTPDGKKVFGGPRVALISEGLWRSRYASDKNVIGKKLLVFGRPTEIIGVMPDAFRLPNASTRIWLPRQMDPNEPYPGGFNHYGIARLKPGVTIAAAEREFANVLPRMVELFPMLAPGVPSKMLLDQAKPIPRLVPMRDDVVGEISRTLWMVAATAALVLLVTCANVANLLLVRADGRHRELSVRAALGAGRARVLVHFFTESAVLAAISCVLGLGAATIGIRALVSAGPAEIPRLAEVHVDGAVIAFTLVVGAFVALACSVIPAIRFLRGDPLSGLRDGGRGGTAGSHKQRARGALVAAQMAFALVVLSASGLLLRSFQRVHAVRPGFNGDGLATLWLALPALRYQADADVLRFYTQLTQRAAQLPGVRGVGLTSRLPLAPHGMNQNPFYAEGDASNSSKIPALELFASVSSEYFQTMGIPLIAGRTFDAMERQHGDEAIISSETAKHFFNDSTGQRALNKRFQELPNGPFYTIVGVVGSMRDTSLSAAPTRAVYFPQAISKDTIDDKVQRTMALVVRTSGDVAGTTRAMQALIREMDPTLPTFDVRPMRTIMQGSIARLSFTMIVLGVAAAVTLVLGVIGLYGVIAYVVTLRTRELGVRIALGAQPRSVAAMVTRQGLALSGVGIVIGLVLVAVVGRFLRSFLFEIAPTDPLTLGGATGLLVAFAFLASWIPARRAARVNPMEALRSD